MTFDREKYEKYLPSKKFIKTMGISLLVIAVIFLIFFLASSKHSFIAKNKKTNQINTENPTINDLLMEDTDKDGVANWEEALWGTDKNNIATFDHMPDEDYIETKKKELQTGEQSAIDENSLTETDKFAREFFASYAAMKASGTIDADAINNFSNALGERIVDPTLIDAYLITDVKTNETEDLNSRQSYYNQVKSLYEEYQGVGIGDELDIINNGLAMYSATGSMVDYPELVSIGEAYQDFAKKLMRIKAPASLANIQLQIANSANNTGISVTNMKNIISDPIVGLSGISQYQKYSDELISAVAELEASL